MKFCAATFKRLESELFSYHFITRSLASIMNMKSEDISDLSASPFGFARRDAGGKDMEFQPKCFAAPNMHRKEIVTILIVSHDLVAVKRFCDRALLLGSGEMRAFEDTEIVFEIYLCG
jgi:hypothetical protein